MLTAVRPCQSQALLPSVEHKLFRGLCSALGAAEVQRPTKHGTAPAQDVGRDARSPVDQSPSISANLALLLGMVNQPLTQLRRVGCAKSSAALSETLLPTSQQPHPTAAFPGMGLQRESKGSLTALPVGLDCVGRSQMWVQMFAELQVEHCYLPLVQITALLTDTSAGAQRAMLLPGLGQPLEVSSTARLNAELHTALT